MMDQEAMNPASPSGRPEKRGLWDRFWQLSRKGFPGRGAVFRPAPRQPWALTSVPLTVMRCRCELAGGDDRKRWSCGGLAAVPNPELQVLRPGWWWSSQARAWARWEGLPSGTRGGGGQWLLFSACFPHPPLAGGHWWLGSEGRVGATRL